MTRRFAAIGLAAVIGAGTVPPSAAAQSVPDQVLADLHYRELGPTRQSGRFVDIAVPVGQPYTFYVAAASGHLWKTTNNGVTFDVLFDHEPVFSIGAIAVAPSDPSIVYVGTGEANNSRSAYAGDGVYKSTDGGQSWANVGLPDSQHIGRIVVHPRDPDVVYVAVLGHLFSQNDERGLYRTLDGGRSWTRVLGPVVEGRRIGVVDAAMDPSDPRVLYAATYDKVRLPFTFDLGGPGSRIYKSIDGGDSWMELAGGLPGGMLGRIGIDVYRRDPSIVYATVENANKPGTSDADRRRELLDHESSEGMVGGEVYRSDDAGATWRKVSPDTLSVGGAPGYYYGRIVIDPNDPDVVHVLSDRSWGTRNGGDTWERQPLGFGGDDHALWIDPTDSRHMILGYDHGTGITYDGGGNWYHPDTQSLAQFYAVGVDQSHPYRIAGGTQDNGSQMAYGTNPAGGPVHFEMWKRVGGGDGMYNEFDWCDNRYLYNDSQFGSIRRLDLWTGESKSIRYDDPDMRYNWTAPILVSPHDCDVVYHAGNKLLRSDFRGESWEVISDDLSKHDPATLTTGKGGDGNIQYATITSVAESPLTPGLIWVGTDDGNVQLTRDGGATWALLNDKIPGNPEYWVSRVEASHHDPGTAYVSFTGYRRDDFRPFVYKTTDYGETWRSIASNLPDEPVNVIREHPQNPDLLFVGTDDQVWVSNDAGGRWTSLKLDMPTVPVHDMKIQSRDDDLIVATHGRGIYVLDLAPLAQLTPSLLAEAAHLFRPEPAVRWIGTDRTNYASTNFAGESAPRGASLYYYLGVRAQGSVSLTVYQGELAIAEIEGSVGAGIHRVVWDMQRRVERSAEEQERRREQIEDDQELTDAEQERIRYEISDVPPGRYRVVLRADDNELTQTLTVLHDDWWMERR